MPEPSHEDDAELKGTLNNLSKLLTHRVRLGICVLLSRHVAISFSRLKELLEESVVSRRKLEEEEFINIKKEFRNRKPITWYSLTEKGQAALEMHLNALEKLIK